MIKELIANIVAKRMAKKLNSLTIKEEDITELLKQIRTVLLNADVNLIVVKDLIKNIREKSIGQVIPEKSNAQQFMLTVIKKELTAVLGGHNAPIEWKRDPLKIMLVGLQGSGKTTTAGKLAVYGINKQEKKPLLVALDIYRPAAIDQLEQLAEQSNAIFYKEADNKDVAGIASHALEEAKNNGANLLVFDTAGRLQTNEELMRELQAIKKTVHPDEILMVVDSMAGQDMINVVREFNDMLGLTGFIITKLDSDAPGGCSLSLTHLLDVPVKLTGTGERLQALDTFYPERMADRIMGLGDIMTLAEKAQDVIDENAVKKSMTRMFAGKMSFEDLLVITQQMQRMGSLGTVLKMMPGAAQNMASDDAVASAEERMRIWTIMLNSMTTEERRNPILFKKEVTRRERVLKGSGRKPDEFNKLYNNWEKWKKQMENIGNELKKGRNPFTKFMGGQ